MVVDDSAVIRGFLTRWLQEDPMIEIVATANNGKVALRNVKSCKAEIVILDIEMPEMDGLTALPLMIKEAPGIQVIMASTLTRRNAAISFQALRRGAVDYVPKPESNREINASLDFRKELIEKVKAFGAQGRRKSGEPLPSGKAVPVAGRHQPQSTVRSGAPSLVNLNQLNAARRAKVITYRKPSRRKPHILAIGSSTGGPQALFKVMAELKNFLTLPVVITQHMPPTFTSMMGEHLSRATGRECREALDGEILMPGQVYIAPGDNHMIFEKKGTMVTARLTQDPPVNFCRPAVDPMFSSLAEIYGDRTLTAILTGMGHDGLTGSRAVVDAGGTLVAQDEDTSVVWGMPGAVATAGLCSEVVPLDQVGPALAKLIMGGLP